jgi:hypothetical protein
MSLDLGELNANRANHGGGTMGIRNGLFGFVVLIGVIAPANAGLLPVNVIVEATGSQFQYAYDVQLQSGAVLKPGDYFTIFDFDGLVAGTNTQPVGFTFSSALMGPTPAKLSPGDSAQLPNLTWTYTGSGAIGPRDLGVFTAVSQFGTTTDGSFTGQTHRQVDGVLNSNVTDTNVPVPSMPNCHNYVPEPPTLMLLVAGLPLALGFRRLRRATSGGL